MEMYKGRYAKPPRPFRAPVTPDMRKCPTCGGSKDYRSTLCSTCYRRDIKGEIHPSWKGNDITVNRGRERAQALYPIGDPCERCQLRPSVDRHHKDGDTANNNRGNIELLCRSCHMKEDGRIANLRRGGNTKPLRPCVTCGRMLRRVAGRGECPACYEFRRRNGMARSANSLTRPHDRRRFLAGITT